MPYHRRIVAIAAAIGALLLLGVFLSAGITLFQNRGSHTLAQEIYFSQLLSDVEAGRIHDLLIRGSEIYGTFNDGHKFQTYAPTDPGLVQRLHNKSVLITTQP